MGIGEQFKGLDMGNLIGGPLTAAANASVLLAQSTAKFINEIGFDAEQKARTVLFKFNRQEPTPEGNLDSQEMSVDIPLLAIVPIPNLQIDEVNIMFDMEVKQCEKSESSLTAGASFSGKAGFGPISVSISGSVSAHNSNTRSSDNSAKYHVDVRATNHGTPEGLARVLDMMAANVAPNLLSSRPVDPSGKELTGASRERNLRLKALTQNGMQLENAETAARETRDIKLGVFIRKLQALQNEMRNTLEEAVESATDKADKNKTDATLKTVDAFWNDLQVSARDKIAVAASITNEANRTIEKICPPNSAHIVYTDTTKAQEEFKHAIAAHIEWEFSNKAVQDNKVEYNKVMMDTMHATTPASAPAS